MRHEGYIYLWRCILQTDFYSLPKTCHLAVHLMLTAAWKDHHIFMGGERILLRRGQSYTGRLKLQQESGLTEQEIRTALKHLSRVGFITIKSTKHGSIITICNYDSYQSLSEHVNPQSNQQSTNK